MKSLIKWMMAAALVATLGLFGCSGDDGAMGLQGDQGIQGEPGPVTTTNESCNLCHGDMKPYNVTSFAQHDSAPYTPNYTVAVDDVQFPDSNADALPNEGMTVTFTVTDGNGNPVDLAADVAPAVTSASVNLSKLVQDGTSTVFNWQNYYNSSVNAATVDSSGDVITPALPSAIQASKTSCAPVATATAGQYTCTVATDFTAVSTPLAVTFAGSLTHRVAVYFGSHLSAGFPGNGWADFVPSTLLAGGTFAAAEAAVVDTRDVATTESCDACHGKLSGHGGDRVTVQICVTCHNPGTTDPESGNVVDMSLMIHKLHAGEKLADINPGLTDAQLDYTIYGHSASRHNYNELAFPGLLQNCEKCHTDSAAAEGTVTANGDAWKTAPNRSACGSCHIVSFDSANTDIPLHTGGEQLTDNFCGGCHAAASIVTLHAIAGTTNTAELATSAVPVDGFFAAGDTIDFTLAVKDTNGNVIDVTDPAALNADRARLYLYGPRDDVKLVLMGGEEQIDLTSADIAGVTQDATGFHYQATIPADMKPGTYLAYAYVRYYADPADTASTRESAYQLITFQVNDAAVQQQVAGMGCGKCHDNGSVAHNNALLETTGSDACLACHNGEHTFPISNRVHAAHAANSYGDLYQLDSTTASGYKEPLKSGRIWTDIEYPQAVTHCQTCHTSGNTSYLEKVSAAPCFGCHGGTDNGVIDHMRQNGSSY